MKKEEKKYVLSLVMDKDRSDVDLLDHEVTVDNFGHTNLFLTKEERDTFLKQNGLEINTSYSDDLEDTIQHICRGDIAYGQAWNSLKHMDIWMKRNADAW